MRRGILSGSPRLAARREVVGGVNELGGKKRRMFRNWCENIRLRPAHSLTQDRQGNRLRRARQRCGRDTNNAGSAVQGNGDHHPQQCRMSERRTGAVAFVGDTRAILALLGQMLIAVPAYHPEPGSSRSLGASSLRRPPRSPRSPPPSRRRSSPPPLLRVRVGLARL